MATNPFALRFTDENYVTRKGLVEALHTSLVDSIWREILSYRASKSRRLLLRSVAQKPFTLCCSDALNAKYDSFERKLNSFATSYATLIHPEMKDRFDKAAFLTCLKFVNDVHGKTANELTMKAMINGMYRPGEKDHELLLNYVSALKKLHNDYLGIRVSEDSLYEIKLSIFGKEPTSAYRQSDPSSVYTSAVVDRNYDYAPYGEIERLMDTLWAFLSSSERLLTKCVGAYFYLDYVKPFEEGNERASALLAKYVLAAESFGEASCFLPLERLFEKDDAWKEVYLETQKTGDLTYIVLYAIEALSPLLDEYLNLIVRIRKETYSSEINGLPKEEAKPKPEPVVAPAPKPVAVEVAAPAVKPVPVSEEEAPVPVMQAPEGAAALSIPRTTKSDKEIKEMARYIVQTNPSIRKAQALFFASHSTIGHYYTIQDFKKSARCAYETARTSMDNLAREGFYQKLQIKNKFVYTPIMQGDNK